MSPEAVPRDSGLESYVDFYDVPPAALPSVRGTRGPKWLKRSLRALREVAPPLRDPADFVPSVLTYLEEEAGLLEQEPIEYEDLLTDLVEFIGGGWAIVEARADLVASLAPDRFSASALDEYYARAPGAGSDDARAGMIETLGYLRVALASLPYGHLLLIHMTSRPVP